MLEYTRQNIFDLNVEAIVNPVNCTGVIGKGLAKQFKEKYPTNFKAYKKICEDKKLSVGILFVYKVKESGKIIINFPIKEHWKNDSNIYWIEDGVKKLALLSLTYNAEAIALPKIGCGRGNLNFEKDVKPILEKYLKNLHCKFIICI